MFDMFYDFHVAPAMRANEMACQQAEDNYNFEADFAATEARIARLRAEIERDWNK